ncbi:epigen [Ictalurus punctatus]|uniref:Epigen n=1 Tax=Ictalurus punctatus TaxID=7998 RepID=A0A9F7RGC0_ICTPU|nr:epigen [Ictalurus punctatus]
MSQCMEKPLCFAVFALASVSLLYSRTVECAETLKLNTAPDLNTTHNLTHNEQQDPLCSKQRKSYCINGLCLFHENSSMPSCTCVCRCHVDYLGERCEHMNSQFVIGPYNLEEVISISCGVILLLACACMLGCCCYRKWVSKQAPPYKNQDNSV